MLFDENGNMVYYKTDQGEMLADGNYSMSLDFDPGRIPFNRMGRIRRPVVRSACVISTNISNHRIKGKNSARRSRSYTFGR